MQQALALEPPVIAGPLAWHRTLLIGGTGGALGVALLLALHLPASGPRR
jgi:hypothetical protein